MTGELFKQWEEIRQGLGQEATNFDLSPGSLDDLINMFNIKVQKCSSGYICFKGYNIGGAQNGVSSGAAFCNYLKSMRLTPHSEWQELVSIL